MKQKSKGGKRPGAGRKKKATKKEIIPLYVDSEIIKNYGGKEYLREFLYSVIAPVDLGTPEKGGEIIQGPSLKSPEGLAFTKKTMEDIRERYQQPLSWPPESHKTAKKSALEEGLSHLSNFDIQAKISAIRAEKCPKERDTPLGRKAWQIEQDKRIAELKSQLK